MGKVIQNSSATGAQSSSKWMGRPVWSGKSDISWWMRLLSQRVAQKANVEDQIAGKFWQSRYRAVRLIEDEVSLACAAYVDLNPIRAGIAQTIEDSQFTSARLRLQTIADAVQDAVGSGEATGVPVGEENHLFERPNLTATGSAQKRSGGRVMSILSDCLTCTSHPNRCTETRRGN